MMTTGHPSDKTHLDRGLAVSKAPLLERAIGAAFRYVRVLTSLGFRVLFHNK
jgi:hypothetical protein